MPEPAPTDPCRDCRTVSLFGEYRTACEIGSELSERLGQRLRPAGLTGWREVDRRAIDQKQEEKLLGPPVEGEEEAAIPIPAPTNEEAVGNKRNRRSRKPEALINGLLAAAGGSAERQGNGGLGGELDQCAAEHPTCFGLGRHSRCRGQQQGRQHPARDQPLASVPIGFSTSPMV